MSRVRRAPQPCARLMAREGKAAWIELPLAYQGVAYWRAGDVLQQPREFSPETIELLRTFANQCAQAISNARLYAITDEALERRVGQLLALANIGASSDGGAGSARDLRSGGRLRAGKHPPRRGSDPADQSALGEVEHWAVERLPCRNVEPEQVAAQRRYDRHGRSAPKTPSWSATCKPTRIMSRCCRRHARSFPRRSSGMKASSA